MSEIDDLINDADAVADEKYLNAHMKNQVNQSLQETYIGYIDINGMQYMMKTMEDSEFEHLCNNIATMVESILDENRSYSQNPNISKDVKFHMFSDNMIFVCDDLQFLIDRMGLLQRRFAIQLQLTLKGCIDKGSLYYYRNRFLLGKGLVSAYKIDADYHNPAIQISRNLVSRNLRGIMKVGFDEYVVDYYRIAAAFSEDFWIEEIPFIKKLIEENLKEQHTYEVMHKYLWLKEYHNAVCIKEKKDDYLIK